MLGISYTWWCIGLDTYGLIEVYKISTGFCVSLEKVFLTAGNKGGMKESMSATDTLSTVCLNQNTHSRRISTVWLIKHREIIIKTHSWRYSADHADDLSCPRCESSLDNEIPFLFLCNATETIRSNYLPQTHLQDWIKYQLTVLSDTQHSTTIARYI